MTTLSCRSCGETKDESMFKLQYAKGRSGYLQPTTFCKSCELEKQRVYINNNRELVNSRARHKRLKRKIDAVERLGGCCQHCKQVAHIAAFDFHHLDPREKDFDPGLMGSYSKERYYKEVDKCILLCANCHRVEHFENGY